MHTVSDSLVACASVNNQEEEAVTKPDSGRFLSRTVSQAEVCYSVGRKDEICTSSRGSSDRCITPADQPRHSSEGNESEWLKLGALSCFPPEVLCKILSFLPLKDFNAVLRTTKAINNCERVRETYLKYVVEALCHRYFGALKGNHKALESKRQHFSRHMDTALDRLRQVAPAGDIDLMEITLRREPLYVASLLRMLSNDQRLTDKERSLHHPYYSHIVPGGLINLPDTNKLISSKIGQQWTRTLTVWDATFAAASHLTDRYIPVYGLIDEFMRDLKYGVFPDGRIVMCDHGGSIYIFDMSQSEDAKWIRVIRLPENWPPENWPPSYQEVKVISADVVAAAKGNSIWLFDLRLPMGHELSRWLRHDYGCARISGFLPTGELVSCEPKVEKKIKVWQSLKSPAGEMTVFQNEEHIKEVDIKELDVDRHLFFIGSMTLNHGGKILFWSPGGLACMNIYDVNRPAGQEFVGSLYPPSSCAPVTTPCGQLLAISSAISSGDQFDVLHVWQLTDNLPVMVRRVNIAKAVLTCPPADLSQFFSLNLIPDGRILATSKDSIHIIDPTKSEGTEVVRTIHISGRFHKVDDVTVVSGSLSVLAYHLSQSGSIQLLDYYQPCLLSRPENLIRPASFLFQGLRKPDLWASQLMKRAQNAK